MNLPSSPKEAFGELPQLFLERSENDDDFGDNNQTNGKLNTPNSVREAAPSSVSRWQWKFWKKSSPTSSKQQRRKQRKYPIPGEILAPLPPGRLNVAGHEKLDNYIDDIAERHLLHARPHSAEKSTSNSIGSPLPPLEMQIMQRPRLFLDLNGSPIVAMEQFVRLQEYNEPRPPVSALQLAAIPKKCLGGDEIALMPCHSLHHRGYEMLSAELWREPVLDRDKNWLRDEMPLLMRGSLHQLQRAPWSMTRVPGPNNRGKWTRYESYKCHIPTRTTHDNPANPTSPTKRPSRILMRAQGALISRSYCVVSIFGEGIYGRLYGAGLTGKDNKRFLHVEAYEPSTSRTYVLRMTLQDIEWIFRVGGNNPEREALVAPGRKQELLRQIIALLYFEYPDDPNNGDTSYANPNGNSSSREEVVKAPKTKVQVLRISPEIQLNEAQLRRLEREESLRQDEARRLEDLAALLGKPRRARHRVLCQTIKLRGRHFYISIYHFPAQARNLVITAYNPSSSITYRLTISLLEAATLVKLYPYPRSGFNPEQTLMIAQGLVPRLGIHGREDSRSSARMMLVINGGRKGPGMNALPRLAPMMTEELQRDELFNKMLRDSQRSLQLELEMTQLRLHNDADAERVEIQQKIAFFEAKRAEINAKDQVHKIRIEEIDAAGGGGGANVDAKRLHEERRTLKTARQTLKGEVKIASAQIAELNQKLQSVSEKEKASDERAQRRTDRARKRVREEVLQSITAAMHPTVPLKRKPVGQRTWLARMHIQSGRNLLASGACRILGKRVRYSLFAEESELNGALDTVDIDDRLFFLELYDPTTCTRCSNLVFSKLELLALTKICHEHQQIIPELAPPTSYVVKRLVELRESIKQARHALYTMADAPASTSSKGKASKKIAPSSKKKREELRSTITTASNEIYRLNRVAPWSVLVNALCERCSIISTTDPTTFEVTLDWCIFRAVSPVLRITSDENEDNTENDPSAVYCHVRVEVLPVAKGVVFEVWDPDEGVQWRLEYPESNELLHEFTVETLIEQQMHLEAIVMALILHPNAETGRLELRFEE